MKHYYKKGGGRRSKDREVGGFTGGLDSFIGLFPVLDTRRSALFPSCAMRYVKVVFCFPFKKVQCSMTQSAELNTN